MTPRIPADYAPAATEGRSGGDVHAVRDSPFGLRVLIADVRGKGAEAATGADALLSAFRSAVRHAPTLPDLAELLEDAVLRHAATQRGPVADEDFATAVVAEFSADGRTLRLLNRGHPAPLLVRPGTVRTLEPGRTAPPLGLRCLATPAADPLTVDFPADGTLLLLTDGTTEARDGNGDFYDPAVWLTRHAALAPEDLVRLLAAEVRAHQRRPGRGAPERDGPDGAAPVPAHAPDDMVLLAVRPAHGVPPVPAAAQAPAAAAAAPEPLTRLAPLDPFDPFDPRDSPDPRDTADRPHSCPD